MANAHIYTVRSYIPYMIGDLYVFKAPVPLKKRKQLVDAVIAMTVERKTPSADDNAAGPPIKNIRTHFINKEWADLPNNFVVVKDDLYYTFRPTRTYAYHLDLLRNEGPIIVRMKLAKGIFRVTTAGWETVGEGE